MVWVLSHSLGLPNATGFSRSTVLESFRAGRAFPAAFSSEFGEGLFGVAQKNTKQAIGSMGLVYLPTFLVDFDGFHDRVCHTVIHGIVWATNKIC